MTHHQPPVAAEAPGVRITACPRGAHLMTWSTFGVERLWLSPLSSCGQPSAIRGGVPVLFPQFAAFGHLPKHGFARTTDWRQVAAADDPGRATLAFELNDSHDTRQVWPHPFHARLDVSASATDLRMSLAITNRDDYDARFTGGLHTYLAVSGPSARITGLGGAMAWDGASVEHPEFDVAVADVLGATEERDMAVHDVTGAVVLHDDVLGDLTITAEGFPDRVVWNPGPSHALADVPRGDEGRFVCIEPAAVTPVLLPAGGMFVGTQVLTVG